MRAGALGDPEQDLEDRLRVFETGLFRALLIVRALLPAATLLVLLAAALRDDASFRSTGVWAILAVWTVSTSRFLWSRIDWARAMPLPVRAEITAFVALVFLGFGTRSWHLLHSFVPLAFVCLFVGAREAAVVASAIVAALWGVYVALALWPAAPIEPRLAATVPTVIVVGSALLIAYVRRLLEDIESILDRGRAAVEAIHAARSRLAVDEAAADVYRQVSDRLRPIGDRVRSAGEILFPKEDLGASGLSGRAPALQDCLDAIAVSLDELVHRDRRPGIVLRPHRPVDLFNEILEAVAASDAIGPKVSIDADAAHAMVVGHDEVRPLQRLLREAVVNARKHGSGDVWVRVPPGRDRVIEVENETAHPIRERAGGLGLHAMHADAAAIGGKLRIASANSRARLTIRLRDQVLDSRESTDIDEELRAALDRRRSAYTTVLLALRFVAAALTAVTIQLEATKHRSLLPALTVTSAFLIAWNAALLMAQLRGWWRGEAGRRLAAIDALAIGGLILAEGGMASPWFALSIGSLVLFGLTRGPAALASLATLFSLSMLGGYFLVRGLSLDDLGTTQQDMPFGLILNTFIYAAAVALVAAIQWAFVRLAEAIGEHQRLTDERRAVERDAAGAEAGNDVHRELHASLQQYVHAALVNLGTLEVPGTELPALRALEDGLTEMRDRLAEVFVELQQRPGRVNRSVSVA
jgi:two-component sensor histidine kinase